MSSKNPQPLGISTYVELLNIVSKITNPILEVDFGGGPKYYAVFTFIDKLDEYWMLNLDTCTNWSLDAGFKALDLKKTLTSIGQKTSHMWIRTKINNLQADGVIQWSSKLAGYVILMKRNNAWYGLSPATFIAHPLADLMTDNKNIELKFNVQEIDHTKLPPLPPEAGDTTPYTELVYGVV